MMPARLPDWVMGRKRFDTSCVVKICNTFDSLEAHVELEDDIKIAPGDEVIVHGEPIRVPDGERAEINRTATIVQAGWLERSWTRMTGDLEFMELCEFSFSEEASL